MYGSEGRYATKVRNYTCETVYLYIMLLLATNFKARSRVTHQEHCTMLESECPEHVATTYGDSILNTSLNTSRYWRATSGLHAWHSCMTFLRERCSSKSRNCSGHWLLKNISVWKMNSSRMIPASPVLFHSLRQSTVVQCENFVWQHLRCGAWPGCCHSDSIPEGECHWENFLRLLKIVDLACILLPTSHTSLKTIC